MRSTWLKNIEKSAFTIFVIEKKQNKVVVWFKTINKNAKKQA